MTQREAGDVGDPVPVGAQDQVRGAGAAQRLPGVLALRGCGLGVRGAGSAVEHDLADGTGFGVGEVDDTDVGEVEFTGVDDLDGEDLVAGGEGAQGFLPGR